MDVNKTRRFSFEISAENISAEENVSLPKWVQIAKEGQYLGYDSGQRPFEFTRNIFNEIVRNFRSHPSFKAGVDGVGVSDVVAWDFHHASERNPTDGTIPTTGAPAQGWARDLQVRQGQDGKAELWALTLFLEPARQYIKDKRYKWASVGVVFDDVDPVSGRNIGARLTSIALTNQPFIEGMAPLAASRKTTAAAGYFYGGQATSPTEAFEKIKCLLGLPVTGTADDVSRELNKIADWTVNGTTPYGVDLGSVISGLREILNLPALQSGMDVIKQMQGLVSQMLIEQAMKTGQGITPPMQGEYQEVGRMDLLQRLSKELGVRTSDEDVISSVKELLELRDGVKTKLGVDKALAPNSAILEIASGLVKDRERLQTLLEALSSKDVDSAVARATDLLGKEKEVAELRPILERFKVEEEKRNETQVEADVTEVLSTRKLPEHVKPALLMFRKNDPRKFAESYPKLEPDKRLLTKDIVTGQNPEIKPDPTPGTIDLGQYPGVNKMARALAHINATNKNSDKLTWDDKCVLAMNLLRSKTVIDSVQDRS